MKAYSVTQKRLEARKWLEICLIASLALHIIIMQNFKTFVVEHVIVRPEISLLDVINVPSTTVQKSKPMPSRPWFPIVGEEEILPPDEEFVTGDGYEPIEDVPAPVFVAQSDVEIFVPYDKEPKPIDGFEAIMKNLRYPEIARKAGVEGRVIIRAQIDESGNVVRTKVYQSLGPNGCDEAAIKAIKSVRWHPALQRDRPVSVWISIPVDFKLK